LGPYFIVSDFPCPSVIVIAVVAVAIVAAVAVVVVVSRW
jgi:hypothetical protein